MQRKNIKQAIYIGGGFVFGQGLMFISQTYLISLHKFSIVGEVGIFLGILSLVQGSVDAGGIFLLSKYHASGELKKYFKSFLMARYLFSFVIFLLIVTGLNFFEYKFKYELIIFSVAVIVFWCPNIVGILDAEKLNKNLVYTSNLNWALAALSIVLFYEFSGLVFIVGASYSLGVLIGVINQYRVAHSNGLHIIGESYSWSKLRFLMPEATGQGISYLAAQSYGRIFPILINSYFDVITAGMFVYAKNFSNAVGQIIIFTRRANFSELASLVKKERFSYFDILKSQIFGICISLFFLFFSIVLWIYENSTGGSKLVVAQFLVLMLFLNLIWSILHAYGLTIIALGLGNFFVFSSIYSSLIGIILAKIFLAEMRIVNILYIELLVYLSQAFIYWMAFRRWKSD